MFKKLLIASAFLFIASNAHAQSTPIIIGPTATLAWENAVPVGTILAHNLSVDGAAPIILTGVTCGASVPPVVNQETCSVLLVPQVPIGTHTLTLTTASGTLTSSPSAPFAYLTLVIPIPSNLRMRP